jgi:LAGLIDADG-like domain
MPRPSRKAAAPTRTASGKIRAQRVIDFIETLTIPSGFGAGDRFKLMPWEKKFIRDIYEPHIGTRRVVRRAILSVARKNGKDLSTDTLIPTPSGWTTMGALWDGDALFDEHGNVCHVTYKSPVFLKHRCYRLTFADGTSIVAGEEHQWLTTHKYRPWASQSERGGRRLQAGGGYNRRPVTEVVTTAQIADSVFIKRKDGGVEHNHKVGVAGAVTCSVRDLPIPPYVLGYWLGNGTSAAGAVTVGKHDEAQIVAELQRELLCELTLKKQVGGKAPQYSLVEAFVPWDRTFSIGSMLRMLGVLNNKHIPDVYLWASIDQRLALLQGLMDSDGTASGGNKQAPRCCFDVMNERLAKDVLQLVRSLGFKATLRDDTATIRGRSIGRCWSVSFTAYAEDQVFRLARRAACLPSKRKARSGSNAIVSCEEVASVPTQCIQVDSPGARR